MCFFLWRWKKNNLTEISDLKLRTDFLFFGLNLLQVTYIPAKTETFKVEEGHTNRKPLCYSLCDLTINAPSFDLSYFSPNCVMCLLGAWPVNTGVSHQRLSATVTYRDLIEMDSSNGYVIDSKVGKLY